MGCRHPKWHGHCWTPRLSILCMSSSPAEVTPQFRGEKEAEGEAGVKEELVKEGRGRKKRARGHCCQASWSGSRAAARGGKLWFSFFPGTATHLLLPGLPAHLAQTHCPAMHRHSVGSGLDRSPWLDHQPDLTILLALSIIHCLRDTIPINNAQAVMSA